MISSRLEKIPEGYTSNDPPALQKLYGEFYTDKMADAATLLKETMRGVCSMEGNNILPEGYRSQYTGMTGITPEGRKLFEAMNDSKNLKKAELFVL